MITSDIYKFKIPVNSICWHKFPSIYQRLKRAITITLLGNSICIDYFIHSTVRIPLDMTATTEYNASSSLTTSLQFAFCVLPDRNQMQYHFQEYQVFTE